MWELKTVPKSFLCSSLSPFPSPSLPFFLFTRAFHLLFFILPTGPHKINRLSPWTYCPTTNWRQLLSLFTSLHLRLKNHSILKGVGSFKLSLETSISQCLLSTYYVPGRIPTPFLILTTLLDELMIASTHTAFTINSSKIW